MLIAGALGTLRAQTDVTSTYITNPSFELGTSGTPAASAESGAFDAPYGWTTENLPSSGTQNFGIFQNDGKTPSNFGKSVAPADGTYYYLGRKSWSGSLAVTFSQSPTLPAGTYALDVAYKIATYASASAGTLQLKASASGSELSSKDSPVGAQKGDNSNYFNKCGWTRISLPFTVAADGEVKLSIVMNFNPGNQNMKQEAILIDDVHLYSISAASPTDPADVTGWLVNNSFELDTYTGTLDGSSTASSGSLNYPTGFNFMLKTEGWNNCVNVTDAPYYGMYARETWAATINELKVYQSLTGLPRGVYEISAVARTNDAGADDICTYGKVGEETTYSTPWDQSKMNATWNGFDNWQKLSSLFAVGDGGTAEVGLHSTHFMQFDHFTMKYYGDVTVAQVRLATYIAAYNAAIAEAEAFTEESLFASDWTILQTAISDNTLNLSDPGLTESQLTTATANLEAANTAATAAVAGKTNYETATSLIGGGTNIDLTSMITNPSFETGNFTGWNSDGSIPAQTQGNKSFDNVQGDIYAEKWHVEGTLDVNQTIKYLPVGIYQASAYVYSSTGDATFYANGESKDVTTSQKYFAVIEVADKGSIKIGVTCNVTGSTWFCFDGFELKYLASSYAALPYTLATGKMGTDKSAAQASAEATFLANPNMTTYEALLSAIADAEASVANYAKLKTAIDKAEGVRDANNFVTAAATTALENEISTATTAWTDVTYTDAQCTSEIATLGSTVSGWHAIADEGVSGAYIASTWSKTPENWFNAPYINTWSTEGDNDGSGFSVPFFEYYTENNQNLGANTFTATLTGLANGMYEVELWARAQRRSDADFNGDNSMITMSVNGGDAVSIMSGQTTVGTGGNTMRLGRYTARGEVSDGTLTLSIDVKLGSNVHWLSWRDITYTKLDAANMTITDAQYATFVAPFDVEIPAEVEAYTVETATGATLNLTPVATTIPANTPVILYKETALAATTFYGKPVAGTPVAGLLTGVYSDTPAPNGSYVLQNNDDKVGFYVVNTAVANPTVGANRAYLTDGGGSEVKAFFFDEGLVDAIRTIDNGKLTMDNAEIFNLAGQRMNKVQKGVNIVNGKKVMVK